MHQQHYRRPNRSGQGGGPHAVPPPHLRPPVHPHIQAARPTRPGGVPSVVASAKTRLKDKKQTVAGFVVFRRTEDGLKYLMLYRRGNYWNFPKGHFEAGEDSMATALRETEEETGLKRSELRILPGFRAQEQFSFEAADERIHDTVILYLAETKEPNIRIAPREHSGFAWFLYEDALRILGKKYAGTKRVLKQANDFLRPAARPARQPNRSSRPERRPWSNRPGHGRPHPPSLRA